MFAIQQLGTPWHALRRRWIQRIFAAAIFAAMAIGCAYSLRAQEAEDLELRLYERTPFDVIVLDDDQATRVEVDPIEIQGSLDPAAHEATEKLKVQFADLPGQEYEIRWGNIAQILRYEQLLLAEAQRLVATGEFGIAFDYFEYLESTFPRLDGLPDAFHSFLFTEAQAAVEAENTELALASLWTLYERRPDFPGLIEMLEGIYAGPIEQAIADGDYRRAHDRLNRLAEKIPQSATVTRLSESLKKVAQQWATTAREHLDAQQWRDAQAAARRAAYAWPDDDDAQELWHEAYERYPIVEVGVRELATSGSDRIDDWAGRRVRRLIQRQLFEAVAYGEEGAQYQSPFGRVEVERLGLRYLLELRPDIRWQPDMLLTAADVARELAARTDRGPQSAGELGHWLEAVDVTGIYDVELDFARTHLRPEALLQVVVEPRRYATSDESVNALGPYAAIEATPTEKSFVRREQYFANSPSAPQEIIERRFASDDEALAALGAGEVSVIDRVAPWTRETFASNEAVIFAPYGAPLVHVLAVVGDDPRLADRAFRRALLYALDRQQILRDQLLHTDELPPDFDVLSAPLPRGYAYDPNIEPRSYDPALALTLASLTTRRLQESDGEANRAGSLENTAVEEPAAPATTPPEDLVLGHPPSEFARAACRVIRQSLAEAGIVVTLKELSRDEPEASCDLRYVELMIWEPVVDVHRICQLGNSALGPGEAYLQLALRRLTESTDWTEARQRLRDLHRILHDDLRLIPLWQTVPYFAFRRDAQGVGQRPMTLYDHVEAWQMASRRVAWRRP